MPENMNRGDNDDDAEFVSGCALFGGTRLTPIGEWDWSGGKSSSRSGSERLQVKAEEQPQFTMSDGMRCASDQEHRACEATGSTLSTPLRWRS